MSTIMGATLSSIVSRTDPDGNIAQIVELLSKSDAMIQDALWKACNSGSSNVTTIRNGIGGGYWLMTNQGVPSTKTSTAQTTDTTGMLKARSTIAVGVLELEQDPKAYRSSEDAGIVMGMAQDMESSFIYGTAKDKNKFPGVATRLASYQTKDDKKASYNVIDAGGRGNNNTSVYLICWGKEGMMGLYPEHVEGGLKMKDLGMSDVDDENGDPILSYKTEFTWYGGLVIRDWRYVVRIANIDADELAAGSVNLTKLLIQAKAKLPAAAKGYFKGLYCRQEIMTALEVQMTEKPNAALTWDKLNGEDVVAFQKIPFRRCDSVLLTEANVPEDTSA